MRIIGTGFACLDIINAGNQVRIMNGGTCANVITALSQLGDQATVILPDYAEDQLSEYFYNTFKLLGVSVIKFWKTKHKIPRVIESYNEEHMHFFYTKCPNCHRDLIQGRFINLNEADKLMSNIVDNEVLFIDRISDGIKKIASEFNEKGKKVFYEPNSGRNLEAVIGMAKKSDVVKFSTDRISLKIADRILEECQCGELQLLIATQGEGGLQFAYRDVDGYFTDWISGPHIDFETTIDTSGAGDWLSAGFLHYWSIAEFALERDVIYGSLKKGLYLSDICSQIEGAQGVFYNDKILKELKEKANIKLKYRIETYSDFFSDALERYCTQCLIEWED